MSNQPATSGPAPEVLEKIKKLLRVDKDATGATEAERANALAMAQKLAMRYGVDISEIDVAGISAAGEPFVSEEFKPMRSDGIECKTRYPVSHKWIVKILCQFFAVDVIQCKARKDYKDRDGNTHHGIVNYLQIHGRKTNVQIAIYVYGFLFNEFNRQWKEHCAGKDQRALWAERNGFYYGVYLGLREKLFKEKGNNEKEIQTELANKGQSMELVVVKEQEKQEASLKGFHPRLKYVKTDLGQVNDWDTHNAGKARGSKIEIKTALK